MSLFPSIFCTIAVFVLYNMESTQAIGFFVPDSVFYLVTTGWMFYIRLCENSTKYSTNQYLVREGTVKLILPVDSHYYNVEICIRTRRRLSYRRCVDLLIEVT